MTDDRTVRDKLAAGVCTSIQDQMTAAFEIDRLRRGLTKIAESGTWMHRTLLADMANDILKGKDYE
jgi:hypothetical protein